MTRGGVAEAVAPLFKGEERVRMRARVRDLQARVVRAFQSDGAPWIGKGRGGGQRRRRGEGGGNEWARRQVTSCDGSGVNEVADSRGQTRERQTYAVGVNSLTVKILFFILFSFFLIVETP
jgi:hypothetical protein